VLIAQRSAVGGDRNPARSVSRSLAERAGFHAPGRARLARPHEGRVGGRQHLGPFGL